MCRALLASSCLLVVLGCTLPPERLPLPPLPQDSPPQPYAQIIDRARRQAQRADEFLYTSRWRELQEEARGLEETATFLTQEKKLTAVPASLKDRLPVEAGDLGKEAGNLLTAAKAENAKAATTALSHINLKVRSLRPPD